jgi:hypothetical protein
VKRVLLRAALIVVLITATGCGYTLGGAPRLLFPANGSTIGCATGTTEYPFTWDSVPNVQTYNGEVRSQPADVVVGVFTVDAPVVTATLPNTIHTCGALETFRWRVCASFKVNPTPACSDWWTFSIP